MTLRTGTLVGALAGALAVTTLAHAEVRSIYANSGKTTTTTSSGHSGKDTTISIDGGFIYGLRWSENGDEPCWFEVYGASFEDGKWVGKSKAVGIDGCKDKRSSRLTLAFYSPETPLAGTAGNVRFIRSLQVCSSERKTSYLERVKGIRMKAAETSADGSIVTDDSTEEQKRPHCKTWEKAATCPDGTAATGITVQWAEGAGARGMSLVCAPPTSSKPRPRG